MTNLSKTLLFLSFTFTLVACKPTPVIIQEPPQNKTTHGNKDDNYYNTIKRNDTDRADVLKDIRDRYSGSTCDELDRKDSDKRTCEKQCDDMYQTRTARKDCEELEVSLIEDLFDLFEILEEADDLDELKVLDYSLFDVYLNVSISGLVKIADRYSENEAEDFLLWVLENELVLDIFRKEDKEHDIFESILAKFDSQYNTANLNTTFTKKLKGSELMQIAIQNEESSMHAWFLDFINEKNEACDDDTETKDCFQIYCRIGDELDKDDKGDWSEFPEFEDYLKEIISDKVNSKHADSSDGEKYNRTGWSYGRHGIEDLGDLSDDWVNDLCHGLTK